MLSQNRALIFDRSQGSPIFFKNPTGTAFEQACPFELLDVDGFPRLDLETESDMSHSWIQHLVFCFGSQSRPVLGVHVCGEGGEYESAGRGATCMASPSCA